MFDPSDKRAMNKGFGDGMSRAFEVVATPAAFGGFGYLVDRMAGTVPVFTAALALFGVVGVFVRLWYGYDAEMRAHEASARWAPGAAAPATEPEHDLWAARRGARHQGAER